MTDQTKWEEQEQNRTRKSTCMSNGKVYLAFIAQEQTWPHNTCLLVPHKQANALEQNIFSSRCRGRNCVFMCAFVRIPRRCTVYHLIARNVIRLMLSDVVSSSIIVVAKLMLFKQRQACFAHLECCRRYDQAGNSLTGYSFDASLIATVVSQRDKFSQLLFLE